MVMLSTVFLVALVMLVAWGTHPLLVLLFLAPFSFIEGVFLSANILNIPHGGWFSITLAGAVCRLTGLTTYVEHKVSCRLGLVTCYCQGNAAGLCVCCTPV